MNTVCWIRNTNTGCYRGRLQWRRTQIKWLIFLLNVKALSEINIFEIKFTYNSQCVRVSQVSLSTLVEQPCRQAIGDRVYNAHKLSICIQRSFWLEGDWQRTRSLYVRCYSYAFRCVWVLVRWTNATTAIDAHWIMPPVRCIQMCDSCTFARMQGIFYSCCYSYGTFNPFSVCLNLPSHKIPIEWNANIQKTEHMYPTRNARCATSILCFHCLYYRRLLTSICWRVSMAPSATVFECALDKGGLGVGGRILLLLLLLLPPWRSALCSLKNDFANKI